jgi:hypothetical protein
MTLADLSLLRSQARRDPDAQIVLIDLCLEIGARSTGRRILRSRVRRWNGSWSGSGSGSRRGSWSWSGNR